MPHKPQILHPAHARQHPAVAGGTVAIISGEAPKFPATQQGHEQLAQQLDQMGLDYEPSQGPRSRVWDQAENRLHVQKALMLWLLGAA